MVVRNKRVSVSLESRSYDIVIKSGLISELCRASSSITSTERIGIVTDRHVAKHYLPGLLTQCERAGFHPVQCVLRTGKKIRRLRPSERFLECLAKERLSGSHWLIALGGGVVGNIEREVDKSYRVTASVQCRELDIALIFILRMVTGCVAHIRCLRRVSEV